MVPWRREWSPTPVFLPGEFHEQRSLAGCSPWGHEEWVGRKWVTNTHTHLLYTYFKKLPTPESWSYPPIFIFLKLYSFAFYLKGLDTPGIDLCLTYEMKVAQSCPTHCDPMDYTVHGILQPRILEWVAVPFSSRSSQPRDRTQVSHTASGFFTTSASWEAWYIITPS